MQDDAGAGERTVEQLILAKRLPSARGGRVGARQRYGTSGGSEEIYIVCVSVGRDCSVDKLYGDCGAALPPGALAVRYWIADEL